MGVVHQTVWYAWSHVFHYITQSPQDKESGVEQVFLHGERAKATTTHRGTSAATPSEVEDEQ